MVIRHDDLISTYKEMLDEKNRQSVLNITSNTGDVLSKSHPKSKIVTRYEEELFGLDPEEIQKLPIKSVEMLQQALQFLIQKAKEDPTVFQALRKLIRNAGNEVEEANPEAEEDLLSVDGERRGKRNFRESKEEVVIDQFKSLLSELSEGKQTLTEATINYKALSTMKATMAKKSASFKMFLDAFNLSIEGMTTQQLQGAVMFANQIGQQVIDNPELKAKFATLFTAEKAVQKKKQDNDPFSTIDESLITEQVEVILEKVGSLALDNPLVAHKYLPANKPITAQMLADLYLQKFKDKPVEKFIQILAQNLNLDDNEKRQIQNYISTKTAPKGSGGNIFDTKSNKATDFK